MTTYIALLRGINVGGHNKVPMARLRPLCEALGWSAVQTYIQSGNIVFEAAAEAAALESRLEKAIEGEFGITVAVVVRAAATWPEYVAGNPFADASAEEPNRVMLALSKAAPKPDAAASLRTRAAAYERIEQVGDALWIHFGVGAGTSKLSPALLDRLVGSPVTMRNWRTVLRLDEMARASSPG